MNTEYGHSILSWLCVQIESSLQNSTYFLYMQVVPYLPEGDFQAYGLRILFDVSFFIIVTTIGLNIVFGIIIDTFAELRDERVSVVIVMMMQFVSCI